MCSTVQERISTCGRNAIVKIGERTNIRPQKPGLYPVLCVCVCVCVCLCWWGEGQDVITIQTSAMTPLSATVKRVSTDRGVGGWGSGYKCILLSQRVLVYACAKCVHRR